MAAILQTRIEADSIGTMPVPRDAYYGVQTLRARHNFPITGRLMHPGLIDGLALVKKASALANKAAGELDGGIADAIATACDEILSGALRDQFIVDAIQGGAGTSANMNANEVIANRAIELMGGEKGDYSIVHPNDHVNMAQSTNDAYPTAGKIAAVELLDDLLRSLYGLETALKEKAAEFDCVIKMGRTQLQDAVPMRLGQSFAAWAAALRRGIARLERAKAPLLEVNMGGTAIGTGINASPIYREEIVGILSRVCRMPFRRAENLIDCTQNLDSYVEMSGALKGCAVTLSKICNDLRLLSSGPTAGLGEINLPAMQNGSSIMPGKVNPVIPEVVSQVAFGVAGNDLTITMAAEAGQLELNAFEPVLFDRLFDSIGSLKNAVETLTQNCIRGITANEARCREQVEHSAGLATALCPALGYHRASELAKLALKTGRPLRELAAEETNLEPEELDALLDAMALTQPPEPGKRKIG
ncbi:MAG: aspartate ammonia-lyase [Oscillospiraceae bacterium]